jgi:hypothetical protein
MLKNGPPVSLSGLAAGRSHCVNNVTLRAGFERFVFRLFFFPFLQYPKVNPARDSVRHLIEVESETIFASCVRKIGGVYELLETF